MPLPVPAAHPEQMRASALAPETTPLQVANRRDGATLASAVVHANGFWLRLVGLLGRQALEEGEGLLLEPCNSVHTFFMSFPIDLLFLDGSDRVVRIVEALPPWRLTWPVGGARRVLELPAGTVRRSGTTVGDELSISSGGSR